MYRYADFVEKYFGVTVIGNQENVKLRCLFHDDSDPSMSFHMDKGVYKCFSCNAHGGIMGIAKELGLTIIGDSYIEELDDPDAEWAAFARSLAEREDAEEQTYLPEKYLTPYLRARNRYRVWAKRGIHRLTVNEFQLGYDALRNHLIIPCRHSWGKKPLVGITRRQLNPGAKPKYLDAKGFRKRQSIFGTWASESHSDTWVLTEGPIDAIKVWQAGYNGRAIMGGQLSQDHVKLMLKLGVENVVLFFDDDGPGFKKAASAMGRLQRRFGVSAANYGNMSPKDPGDMNTEQIRWAVNNAISLNDILVS